MNVNELIAAIKGKDEKARAEAWLNAGPAGAEAIKPLSALVDDKDTETSRAAKRAMWKIVRHTGRPGAQDEAKAVADMLVSLLGQDQSDAVRREVAWMLSEIGGDSAVLLLAAILSGANRQLCDDARMVLQRIPGDKSLAVLKDALASAPEDFKPALAESLRVRGVQVDGIPCRKLVPTKKTEMKPVGR